jgi:hypothetical protein
MGFPLFPSIKDHIYYICSVLFFCNRGVKGRLIGLLLLLFIIINFLVFMGPFSTIEGGGGGGEGIYLFIFVGAGW